MSVKACLQAYNKLVNTDLMNNKNRAIGKETIN